VAVAAKIALRQVLILLSNKDTYICMYNTYEHLHKAVQLNNFILKIM